MSFLRNEVYFLSVGRANAVAAVTGGGIVLLDAMPAGWGPAVLEALQQVSYMPVTTIINTHAHEDHSGADAEYPGPVQFVMHENSSRRLAREHRRRQDRQDLQRSHAGDCRETAAACVLLRQRTYRWRRHRRHTRHQDRIHWRPLRGENPSGRRSGLRRQRPGAAADAGTGRQGDHWRRPCHHGPWTLAGTANTAGSRAGLPGPISSEYAEFVREFVDAVSAGWKNGRTAEQVGAELRMPEKYKDYRLDGAKVMIETIFNELKQSPAPKR